MKYKVLLRNANNGLVGSRTDSGWHYALTMKGWLFGNGVDGLVTSLCYKCEKTEGEKLQTKMDWRKGTILIISGELKINDARNSFKIEKIHKIKVGKKLSSKERELLEIEKNPPSIFDEKIGKLTWDNCCESFMGKTKIQNENVSVSIETEADWDLLIKACNLKFIEEAREYAANNLLETANDCLEQTDESENEQLTKEQLKKIFKIECINVDRDSDKIGQVCFQFSDEMDGVYIFGGHSPLVYWDEKNGFTDAQI